MPPPPPRPAVGPAPDQAFEHGAGRVVILACGALAREILALIKINNLQGIALTCLPANLHNAPQLIPEAVERKILELRERYDTIYVAYADCGTGGALDRVLQRYGVARIGGPHCYSFFATAPVFDDLMEQEIGSFFLTDYLARHFKTLIIKGMGLERDPLIREAMFAHYTRLVYLAQTDDPALEACAREAADYLQLTYVKVPTGMGTLAEFVRQSAPEA